MVVSLGPGKFYGSSLPRPRIYDDVKFNSERIDPPVPVLDPLLSWATEAHWSMGGLSFKRLRLQGRIEGNVNKLRAELTKKQKNQTQISNDSKSGKKSEIGNKRDGSVSPPPAPMAVKRRRYMALIDESEEEEEVRVERKKPARKLYEEFDKVAKESEKASGYKKGSGSGLDKESGLSRTRGRSVENDNGVVGEVNGGNDVKKVNKKGKKKVGESGKSESGSRVRVSPRLAKGG